MCTKQNGNFHDSDNFFLLLVEKPCFVQNYHQFGKQKGTTASATLAHFYVSELNIRNISEYVVFASILDCTKLPPDFQICHLSKFTPTQETGIFLKYQSNLSNRKTLLKI